jgi:hypothetical protein
MIYPKLLRPHKQYALARPMASKKVLPTDYSCNICEQWQMALMTYCRICFHREKYSNV